MRPPSRGGRWHDRHHDGCDRCAAGGGGDRPAAGGGGGDRAGAARPAWGAAGARLSPWVGVGGGWLGGVRVAGAGVGGAGAATLRWGSCHPAPRGGRGGGVGLPGGFFLGLGGGLGGERGEQAHRLGGAPERALAGRVGERALEGPLDLGEQAAAGDEAVGAQLGVVGEVQVDVHDASSSRAACPSPQVLAGRPWWAWDWWSTTAAV